MYLQWDRMTTAGFIANKTPEDINFINPKYHSKKDKDEEDTRALYKQSKLELTKLKEKNKLQEETMKKC